MIYSIYCSGKKFISVDTDGTTPPKKGDTCQCVDGCTGCKNTNGYFTIVNARPGSNSQQISPCYYSANEKSWKFGSKSASSIGNLDDESEAPRIDMDSIFAGAGSSSGNTYDEPMSDGLSDVFGFSDAAFASVSEGGQDDFMSMLAAEPKLSGTVEGDLLDSVKEDIFLNIPKNKDFFQIGTMIYSDDFRKYSRSKPLKMALLDIFYHWRTKLVFGRKTDQLDDAFKWLLVNSQGKGKSISEEDKDTITKILKNKGLDIDQKFFYIFYCVINKKNRDLGFYFKNNSSGEILTECFKTKSEFAHGICKSNTGNNAIKTLYEKNQREILYYLGYLDDDEVLEESGIGERVNQKEKELFHDLVIDLARERNQVLFIERDAEKISVRNFGTVIEFCEKMKTPTDLDEMSEKCTFLKNFKIDSSYNVGVYRKNEKSSFEQISFDNESYVKPQDIVYSVLGLKSSSKHLAEYGCYLSLLKEYIKIFNPKIINLPNDIVLSKDNFLRDISTITKEAVMNSFNKSESEKQKKSRGNGYLIKNLIDNKILEKFVSATQSSELDKYIDLLEAVVSNKSTKASTEILKKYIDLYKDDATFVINSRQGTIKDHLQNLRNDTAEELIRQIENNEIIKAYFELERSKCKTEISSIKEEIKKLEAKAKNGWK